MKSDMRMCFFFLGLSVLMIFLIRFNLKAVQHCMAGSFYYQHGKFDVCIPQFKKAIEYETDFFRPNFYLGSVYTKKGVYQEARRYYENAINICPNSGKTHYRLGNIYEKLGDDTQAIKHYKTTLGINEQLIQVHNRLVALYVKQQNLKDAMDQCQRSLELNPGQVQMVYNLGVIYSQLGREADAREQYRRSLVLNPDHPQAKVGLAAIDLKKKYKNDLKSPTYFMELGDLYREAKMPEQAFNQYKEALELKPDALKILNRLVLLFNENHNFEKAIYILKKITRINPHFNVAYYNMACLYSKLDKMNTAVQCLEKAVQNGYRNWEAIKTDKDLEKVRRTAMFRKFMIQYASK